MSKEVIPAETELADADLPRIPLFERYRPSHRLALASYMHTLHAGQATAGLAALFIWGFWGQPQWLNWSVFGVGSGMIMLLHAARLLPRSANHRLKVTQYLAHTRESWFGYFIFACQNIFMVALASLLWFALPVVGVSLNVWLHAGFWATLVFVIGRRFLMEWAYCHNAHSDFPWHDVLRWVTVMIVTILIAIATSNSISPLGHPITGDTTLLIVIIWIIASFVILCAVIMLIDRLLRRNRDM